MKLNFALMLLAILAASTLKWAREREGKKHAQAAITLTAPSDGSAR
jgi:hypothetical protein